MAEVPTCKIHKGNKTRIINVADLAEWKEDGWKEVEADDDVTHHVAKGDQTRTIKHADLARYKADGWKEVDKG